MSEEDETFNWPTDESPFFPQRSDGIAPHGGSVWV
jgi:hypothetical protein